MSDVITQVTAPEQTGVANPADAIAAMIAANKRNNPQPDGSSPPPAGQDVAQAKSPEAAPVEGVEPEDGSSVESDAAESEVEAESSEGVNEAVDFLEFAKENPDVMLKIPNKDAEGGFIELTAEKAASILGQGSAMTSTRHKTKTATSKDHGMCGSSLLESLRIGTTLV